MKTLNQPSQTDQSNEGHSLGEMCSRHNPRPWVVVEFAGMENEDVAADFKTFREAADNITTYYGEDEVDAMFIRIMRRNDDGTLTTVF